jgi:NAD(P)-dependent dehydrogenase (short-subunit alcohol dehydrogenase family)
MRDNGGSIVNITMDNRNGFPMLSHSAAARAGIQNLTMSLANEWGKYGVRINSVAPGTVESSGLDSYAPPFQEFVRTYGKHNQNYRLGTEAEIASAVVFLLSPGASFINGLNMAVDGGESIYTPLMPPSENEKHEKFDDQ